MFLTRVNYADCSHWAWPDGGGTRMGILKRLLVHRRCASADFCASGAWPRRRPRRSYISLSTLGCHRNGIYRHARMA